MQVEREQLRAIFVDTSAASGNEKNFKKYCITTRKMAFIILYTILLHLNN